MKTSPDVLQDQLERYEAELKSIKSYLRELHDMTGKHGTEKEQFGMDLLEAENNAQYYEARIAHVKNELKAANQMPRTQTAAADTILPQTIKQGVGSLLFSSMGFLAGVFLGSRLVARRSDKDTREGE
jgi:septal ring factor EnvC (AmiA/AmiB activator)